MPAASEQTIHALEQVVKSVPTGTDLALFHLLWVMAPDGSGQVQLTHDEYDHFRPVWSPDGSQIAYGVWTGARNEIWVMDVEGSNPRRVTDQFVFKLEYRGYGLAWNPLQLISFVSDRKGPPQIYLISPDGSWQRAITAMPRGAWSPDWTLSKPSVDR